MSAPRYSQQQLQAMARQFVQARNRDDQRCDLLVMQLMLRTGLAPHQIESRIQALAQGGAA